MTVDIICADAREALARFPDGHFHCCVTSPPFWGLRDYGLEPTVWGGEGCQKCQHGEMAHIEDAMTKVSPCGQCSCPEYLPCEHEWGEESSRRYQEQQATYGGQCGPKATAPTRPRTMRESVISEIKDVRTGAFCRRCNAWRGTLGLEPTPELYVEHLVSVMREVRRVLRPDGTLWLNLGDSYNAAREGGWAGGKHGVSKPENAPKRSGVNAPGLKPKDLVGVPWMVAFALRADGWWLRSDIVWSKPNPMPESVTDRPTRSHEYVFLLTKSARYAYDQDAIREKPEPSSLARYDRNSSYDGSKPYAMKQGPTGPKADKQRGHSRRHAGFNDRWDAMSKEEQQAGGVNKRSVWEIATQPYPDAHFATFPEKLVEPCILAGCPPAGKRCDCDDLIATPLGSGPIEDPSLVTGRAGLNRPRRSDEGVRPITRREQRSYAVQMSKSFHRAEMEEAAGSAFDHYVRTDNSGARPLPPDLLSAWLECSWLVHPGPCGHPEESPGTVLDPFAGSGTVGLVAERLGRHSVLIDAKEEYCEMARHRTAQRGLMMEAK